MRQNTRLVSALVLLAACNSDRSDRVHVTAQLTDEASSRVLTLSHTLGEVAVAADATTLEPDLIIDGGDDGFGYVVDVAATEDKLFVLNAVANHIRGFNEAGSEIVRFGREGRGPGEFGSPLAIAATDRHVIMWQSPASQALAVWDHAGVLRSAAGATINGDWDSSQWRRPRFHGLVDAPPEDLPHRLQVWGPDHFVQLLQPDNGPFGRVHDRSSSDVPPAHLVRHDFDLDIVDTIAVVAGGRLEVVEEAVYERNTKKAGRIRLVQERLYTGRPVWTMGNGWIAISHGDSTGMIVRHLDGSRMLEIRWPSKRPIVQEPDKREAAKWMLAYQAFMSTSSRELIEASSRRELEEGIRVTAFEWTKFADQVPTITAAFSAGECVFLAGFSPVDNRHGVALTWLAINVTRGTLEGVLRFEPATAMKFGRGGMIDRHGGAVRAFTTRHAYLVSVNGDGESFVERFRLPPSYNCGSED